jgi:hypothetical protein
MKQYGWVVVAAALLGAGALASSGCELAGTGGGSCSSYSREYQQAIVDEGALASSVEVDGPYPMALMVSQDALNRLFAAVADNELPPIQLLDDVLGLPISLTLRPELPFIQVGGDLGCLECLLTEFGFGLSVGFDGDEITGRGAGRFQFPLSLQPNGLESTRVNARFGQSTLLAIDLDIGIEGAAFEVIEDLAAAAATQFIRSSVGDTELFELGAWSIGDGDVKMLARGPIIDAAAGTVVLGVHTNMIRPLSGAVALDTVLPEGADIGMQFHPELIQTMVQRMLHEGHIDRSYDLAGQVNPEGDNVVSLDTMEASESGLLRTNFTLWRTGGGLCGFAGLQADLGLSISDRQIALAVENIGVTDSGGIGSILEAVDGWYSSAFTEGLINFSELTINYRELTLPNGMSADMSAESFRLDLDGSGLSVYLNIDSIL